jgi:subtilase family serine protease
MRLVVRRLVAVLAAAMVISLLAAPAAGASQPTWTHRDNHVCAKAGPGDAACASIAHVLYQNGAVYHARTARELDTVAKPAATVSYSAVGIRKAYGITASGDPSRVIAIVDAYDDTAAFTNLTAYRAQMGLPTINNCTVSQLTALTAGSANPCFSKTDQNGGTSYPAADAGWANEIDLDLQAASAVCPMCSILLLEASSSSFSALGAAETTASNTAHVLAISNSYGSTGDAPGSSYTAWDNAAKKGIAVMASTGDNGYGPSFPASGTYVIGVGGTNVQVDANGVRTAETAWSGAGSGCSTYNAAASWQVIAGSPCGTKKAIADVSADADPYSGLQVYTNYNGTTGWNIFGGTSLASPLVGALYAMQGGYSATTLAGAYAWAPTTGYYDVTSGTNGTCSPSALCTAGVGWDGPTGRGSILIGSAPTQTLTSISVSPASASVVNGSTQQFSATAYDQNGVAMASQPAITWSVSGGGSISASGLFTANAVGGPFTVTAASGGVSGTASVSVTAGSVLTSIAVSPSGASVLVGGTQQFTASAKDQNGVTLSPQPAITWSVSGGGTISSSGLFTATTAGGPYTVTATSGSVNGTASITVTAPVPDFSLSVSPNSRSIKRGGSTTYTITITRRNGFTGGVTFSLAGAPTGSTVTWSANPSTGTSVTLSIKTSSSAKVASYTLTITGTSGSLTHTVLTSLKLSR